MCGIAGFIDVARAGDEVWLAAQARAMGNALAHRGPDHGAVYVDTDAGVGLAHRRLADRRPVAGGRAADGLGRRPLRHGL